MENLILLTTFLILLSGVFILKKLWLGTLLSIIFFLVTNGLFSSQFNFSPLISSVVISIELGLLLFGAYLFYSVLQVNQHFNELIKVSSSFSSKLTVLIILSFFLLGFMEGIAGFGIPAMLIAPLLFTCGFTPLTCIVLPLAMNTTAVLFGALGTPLKVGLGISEPNVTVYYVIILNALPALLLPFITAFLFGITEQYEVKLKANWKLLLGAGVSFAVPFSITALISIEFPSVISGFIGLLIFVNFFIPKSENPPLLFWLKTFYPYFIFVGFLLFAKFSFAEFFWEINQSNKSLSFYQPGLVFIFSSMVYLLIQNYKNAIVQFFQQCETTFQKTLKSIATIFLLVFWVQLVQGDLSNIISFLFLEINENSKHFLNPVIGVIGSFITGSATMSNLLFGKAIAANQLIGTHLSLMFALLHSGSAIGNAISLQNIIMVKSVINQPSIDYTDILKLNLFVVGFYLFLIIVASFLIVWF